MNKFHTVMTDQISSERPEGDPPNMSAEDELKLEQGRKLFAGDVEFVKGVVNMRALPEDDRGEVAFAGRSNVGKSSLINALTNRNKLARASTEPGRTREINYFDLSNGALYLVDLPGFGYAKVSKTQSEAWMKLTRQYLRGRASLRRVFLLIDSRRGIGKPDEEVMKLLDTSAVIYQVVLTKTDKLKKGEAEALKAKTETRLKTHGAAHPVVMLTSSEKGWGIPELRAEIAGLV